MSKEDLYAVYLAGKLDGKRAAERKFDKALEIEELRKDSERLDWLLENAVIQHFPTIHPDDLCRITSKDDVDNAMKGTI